MQIFNTLDNTKQLPLALTIGNFDGVHIGHQAILSTLVNTAEANNYHPAVMTFTPHAKVFFGCAENFLLSSDAGKADCIAKCGIKSLWQIPFDKDFSQISASDFIDSLIRRLAIKYLLVGDDFRFGYRGQGDFTLLQQQCAAHAIRVDHTPTIYFDNHRVSSSRVRQAIVDADFELASKLLGRPVRYHGKVIRGQQLGRSIDFPTANIRLPKTRLLPDGVFAVSVVIQGSQHACYGMCNIGTKPTVDASQTRQIEVHLFDFDGDLYDKTLSITLLAKIREEQKFAGLEALISQLHQDKNSALGIINTIS